jgi:hypothetical protein
LFRIKTNLNLFRQYISDFAVVIAIVSMTVTDMMMAVDTPKLR